MFQLLGLTFFFVRMLVSRSEKHLQVLGTKPIAGGWLSAFVMRTRSIAVTRQYVNLSIGFERIGCLSKGIVAFAVGTAV